MQQRLKNPNLCAFAIAVQASFCYILPGLYETNLWISIHDIKHAKHIYVPFEKFLQAFIYSVRFVSMYFSVACCVVLLWTL